jgi:hypothetical protein
MECNRIGIVTMKFLIHRSERARDRVQPCLEDRFLRLGGIARPARFSPLTALKMSEGFVKSPMQVAWARH